MSKRIRVNMIACEAHGVCAELFPERIRLDEWGYPIVDPSPIPSPLESHARRAVAGCPRHALMLEKVKDERPAVTTARRLYTQR